MRLVEFLCRRLRRKTPSSARGPVRIAPSTEITVEWPEHPTVWLSIPRVVDDIDYEREPVDDDDPDLLKLFQHIGVAMAKGSKRDNRSPTEHTNLDRFMSKLSQSIVDAGPYHGVMEASPSMSPILLGRYRWTGEWFFCRIRSCDVDGTCTVVWSDGFLQIGTSATTELRRVCGFQKEALVWETIESAFRAAQRRIEPCQTIKKEDDDGETKNGSDRSLSSVGLEDGAPPYEYRGKTVWEAAKQGDFETCLFIIDRGMATPNDVEQVFGAAASSGGRRVW
jgi:hypothetical protein